MPKGPRGEKRPADVIGGAVKVAKIATGEIEDERYVAPGRKKSGQEGGRVRAERLTPGKRRRIALQASQARWEKTKEQTMDDKTAAMTVRLDDDAVLMYPDNQLEEQKRDYDETQSAFSVVCERFFTQK